MGVPAILFTIIGVLVLLHLLNVFVKAVERCLPSFPVKGTANMKVAQLDAVDAMEEIAMWGERIDEDKAVLLSPISNTDHYLFRTTVEKDDDETSIVVDIVDKYDADVVVVTGEPLLFRNIETIAKKYIEETDVPYLELGSYRVVLDTE